MNKKRTTLNFDKHILETIEQEGVLIHHLRLPNSFYDSFTFINTNGILAVTGDYNNWIFCREFHPSAKGYVSDSYWAEKLRISSEQQSHEFDSKGTINEIKEMLLENEYSDEEKEYLEECMDNAQEHELDYTYFAYRELPKKWDTECVPFVKKIKPQLLYVFDAFDEICNRLKIKETNETNKIKIEG